MTIHIRIGDRPFSSDGLALVVRNLRAYLHDKPEHYNGLCYWLNRRLGYALSYALVDSALEGIHALSKFGSAGSYVDDDTGPTPRRLEFAAALRDELQRLLDQHSIVGQTQVAAPLAISAPLPAPPVSPLTDWPRGPARAPKAGTQLYRVLYALQHGCTTLPEIASEAECLETAASARIRELRNKYGWNIEVRRAPGKAQRFTYHLIGN